MKIFSKLVVILCLLYISLIDTKLTIPKNSLLSADMKNFIFHLISKYSYEKTGFLFLHLNEVDPEYLDYASKLISINSSLTVVDLNQPQMKQKMEIESYNFMLILTNAGRSTERAEQFLTGTKGNRQKLMIIFISPPPAMLISFVLLMLWQIKCLQINIAFESNSQVEMYTLNPFLEVENSVVNVTKNKYDTNLFPEKTKNLQGNVLRGLLAYQDPSKLTVKIDENGISYDGKDYNAIKTIMDKINAKLEVVPCEDILENITFNPFLHTYRMENKTEIQDQITSENGIDFLMISQMFKVDDGVFENAYPHHENGLYVILPKGEKYSLLDNFRQSFGTDGVLFIGLFPFAMGILYTFIRKLLKYPFRCDTMYADFYRPLIASNLHRIPKTSWERILLGSWLMFCLVYNSAALSKITSMMSTKAFNPDINTIDQLKRANFKMFTFEESKHEIDKKYEGTITNEFKSQIRTIKLKHEATTDSDIQNFLHNLNPHDAYIFEKDISYYLACLKKYRRHGRPLFHMMRESILPSLQSFQVLKGSPYLPTFNKILRRLEEGGLLRLWEKHSINKATIEGILYPFEDYEDISPEVNALNVYSLKPFIYMLVIGYVISAGVLMLECFLFQRVLLLAEK